MKNTSKIPRSLGIVAFFLLLLLAQYFLLCHWQKHFFIYFFNNTHAFMEATSWAYQHAVNSGWAPAALFCFSKCGVGGYWPVLVPAVQLLSLKLFPSALFLLPNMFYLAIAMLGIYFSTKQLTQNDFCSALAAAIFSCYWAVTIQLVAFELQLAVAACVACSFYGYLRSRYFTRLWPSFVTGVFMVLALYCDRVTPGLFVFALFLIPENFKRRKSWLVMAGTLAFVGLCVLPFYGGWIRGLLLSHGAVAILFSQNNNFSSPGTLYGGVVHSPVFLLGHLAYYFIALPERLLGYGFTCYLILGLLLLKRLERKHAQTLGVAVGFPLVVLTIIIKKEYIYLFPLCVYFAIITGIGVGSIKRRTARLLCVAGVIFLFISQCLLLFHPVSKQKKLFFSNVFELFAILKIPRLCLYDYESGPSNLAWQVNFLREKIRDILGRGVLPQEPSPILFVDFEELSFQNAAAFSLRMDFPSVKIINGFFARTPELGDSCSDGPAYLLTDRKQYADIKQQAGSVCPWKRLSPLYEVSERAIMLYKAQL